MCHGQALKKDGCVQSPRVSEHENFENNMNRLPKQAIKRTEPHLKLIKKRKNGLGQYKEMTVLTLIYSLTGPTRNTSTVFIKLLAPSYCVLELKSTSEVVSKLYQILNYVRSNFPMSVLQKCGRHNIH